jgi:hypothetical protein
VTVYQGYIPSGSEMFAGDYVTSPDGLYYGFLDTTGMYSGTPGLFLIAPGSNPTIAPVVSNCIYCSYPVTTTPSSNLGGFFARMGSDGNLVVYSSATGKNQGTVVPVSSSMTGQSPSTPPYYATIQDNPKNGNNGGSFIFYQGTYPDQTHPLILDAQNIIGSMTGITLSGGASGTGIDYDFAAAKAGKVLAVASQITPVTNYTSQTQQFNVNLSLSYTDTSSFNFQVSDATGISISSSVSVGVPGVVGTSLQFGVTSSTTISKGQTTTTSNSTTFQVGVRPEVPPGYTYNAYLTGEDVSFVVPYTWSGVATYAGGATAKVSGSGIYEGDVTGYLHAIIFCADAPPGSPACPSIPISDMPVNILAEPSTAMILPIALLGAVIARRRPNRQ